MSTIETVKVCPLGAKFTEIVDGKIHECAWHIEVRGTDASGKDHDSKGCALAWGPILALETAKEARHMAAATLNMRNELVKRQDAALGVVKAVAIDYKQRTENAGNLLDK